MNRPLTFPDRACLANLPTPFHHLSRLSSAWNGPRIWVKRDDLTGLDLTGNKIRKLEFSIGAALSEGCDTLLTCGAAQSNHCRTTAAAGARIGLKVHLVLLGRPAATLTGNAFLHQFYGAEVTYIDSDDWLVLGDALADLAASYRSRSRRPFIVPLGLEATDVLGLWGYILACRELAADFRRQGLVRPHILTAIGTGSTVGGLALGSRLYDLGMTVWGVNVLADRAFFERKVTDTMRAWGERNPGLVEVDKANLHILDGYVGEGYGKADGPTLELIRQVATLEGIALDPVYSGKALAALAAEIRAGRFARDEDVVFLHTGSVFGLLAQGDQFTDLFAHGARLPADAR